MGVILAVVLASFAVAPGQANAGVVDWCLKSHGRSYVCVQIINGDGLYVPKAGVSHGGGLDLGHDICKYKGRVIGTLKNGTKYVKTSPKNPACEVYRAHVTLKVKKKFKNNSKFCSRFYHDGKWIGGRPCLNIKK